MAALKHDAQGFLQGEPLPIAELLRSSDAMGKDIRAIRGILEGSTGRARSTARAASAKVQSAPVALSAVAGAVSKAANEAMVRNTRTVNQAVSKPMTNGEKGTASAAIAKSVAQAAVSTAQRQQVRGADGRFGSGGGKGGASGGGAGEGSEGGGVMSRLVGALKDAGNAEEADPAIKAFKEVAQPLARGWEVMRGDKKEKKQERWYRRFWQHMRRSEDETTKNNKLTQKGIKGLLEKPTDDGKGRGGFLPMLLIGLRALLGGLLVKLLPKALLPMAGLGGAAGAGGAGGFGGGGKNASKGGKFGGLKGALGKVPLLGTALALLGGAGAVFASESSGMTRKEKDKATGSAVGGTAGTLGGMFAGAKLGAAIGALGGPIGIAIGGVVGGAAGAFFGDKAGQVIGETVGGWVSTLRDADIPGKFSALATSIGEGFERAMSSLNAGWEAGLGFLKDTVSGVAEWGSKKIDSVNKAVLNATGVDIKAGAQVAVQAAKDTAVRAGQAVKDAAAVAVDTAKTAAKATGEAVKNSTVGKGVTAVASAVKNQWKASDRKSALMAEMDAQGITNKNERAMMLAQMDHETGGFTKGEESFNYRSADRIMEVSKTAAKKGKPAIEAAMKQGPEAVAELMYGGRMGNTAPGDGHKYRGRGHIQVTGKDNYAKLGEKLGLDLVNNPDLLNDPAIAAKASVQWWKDNGVGKAAQAGDVKAATQRINNGQNGFDHRKELYAKYSKDPAAVYSGGAVQMAQVNAAPAVAGTVSAYAPVASVNPAASAQAPVAAAPAVPTVIASAGAGRGNVNPPMVEPSQDLSDRRLAHVATGGIGGAA